MAEQDTTLAAHQHEHDHEHDHAQIDPQLRNDGDAPSAPDIQAAIDSLTEINANNQAILEDLNLTGLLERLQQSIKLLIDSNRRQAEIVSSLLVTGRLPVGQSNESLAALAGAFGLGATTIGSALENVNAVLGMASAAAAATSQGFAQPAVTSANASHHDDGRTHQGEWVPRAQLDALRQKGRDGSEMDDMPEERGNNGDDDKPKKRRKRTMKLEHLIHKIANGRLGVEYTVQGFECQGAKELPDPAGDDEMIQEDGLFRPNFKADYNAPSVRPYLETVIADVQAAWESDYAAREGDQTIEQITRAVNVYWLRLSNRYDEQTTRGKGQVHRDEVTRRRQNQYRRQQSLLARRQIAFEQSPLNVCKLRALYRTLLTIDFTPSTTERAEEGRAYTPEEWEVYRRLANNGKPWDAHEIIDIFWLSPTCRGLMNILDVFAHDQAIRSKRKGRPKAPSPGFHLPPALWDRSKLPTIRPKDEHGLPLEGQGGIVLFKFHVDEAVQLEYPEWAAGLYVNPPMPAEDSLLPSLAEVMSSSSFIHLQPGVKRAQAQCNLPLLSPEQIQAYQIEMERDGPAQLGIDNDGSGELPDDVGEQLQHLSAVAVANAAAVPSDENLESLVALASASPVRLPDMPTAGSLPSTGSSSLRARRTTKAKASEPPGGAATPVKRKRTDADDTDDRILAGLERDHGFLATL